MNKNTRFFVASCIALVVTAMSFAIRGDIMGALGDQFKLTKEQLGWIAGTAFWGFTLAMIFGGVLCDVIGMGKLLTAAFFGHVAGILLTIFAMDFWTLYFGTLLIGLGNGFVEAACNPLIATMYPEKKTEKLNHFHVWFPGGIVIGGLIAFAFTKIDLSWQFKMATMLLPAMVYGAMFFGQAFPRTERVASGVTTGEMFGACLRPLFILLVVCMLMTAATELGPGQWIANILEGSIKDMAGAGILVLVWINGLMALGRSFAGPVERTLSPTGMLVLSALLAGIGLLLLSYVDSMVTAFGAATIYAIGICYFWPTMLGVTSERVPKSGALGLSIMGGAGMLSVSLILPFMGHIYDSEGADMALRYVTVLPAALVLIFGILWLRDRARGGYRKETLTNDPTVARAAEVTRQ